MPECDPNFKVFINDFQQIKVGTYDFGREYVDVYAVPSEMGGSFHSEPEDTPQYCRIKIGLDHKSWWEVVDVAFHETFEGLMYRAGHIHEPLGALSAATDNRIFVFNHAQYGELCARAAFFLSKLLPDLATVWNKFAVDKGYIKPDEALLFKPVDPIDPLDPAPLPQQPGL